MYKNKFLELVFVCIFSRNLYLGLSGNDVKQLQIYLNNNGFIVSEFGSGSLGNETEFFGKSTKKALIKFQEAYSKEILNPVGAKIGTGYFGLSTRNFINSR